MHVMRSHHGPRDPLSWAHFNSRRKIKEYLTGKHGLGHWSSPKVGLAIIDRWTMRRLLKLIDKVIDREDKGIWRDPFGGRGWLQWTKKVYLCRKKTLFAVSFMYYRPIPLSFRYDWRLCIVHWCRRIPFPKWTILLGPRLAY